MRVSSNELFSTLNRMTLKQKPKDCPQPKGKENLSVRTLYKGVVE